MQETIFVTGANGFLGQHLIHSLLSDEATEHYFIKALVRSPSKFNIKSSKLQVYSGDLTDVCLLSTLLSDVTTVVHLAAEMDFYPKCPSLLCETNIEGTRTLLNACQNNPVKRFIYCSTTETIGASPENGEPANEDSECRPFYLYAKTKLEAEVIVRSNSSALGINYVILRPTGIYGLNDTFTTFELINAINYGLFFFLPESENHKLMYTHVADVVQAFSLAIQNTEVNNETIIICPDQAISYKDVITCLAIYIGRAPPRITFPLWFVKLGTRIVGLIWNLRRKRNFMFEVHTIDRMSENRVYDNSKARKLLGFRPTYNFEEGAKETVAYLKNTGQITHFQISPVAIFSGFILVCAVLSWWIG